MACTAFSTALELARNRVLLHPDEYVLLCVSGVNSYWFHNQVRGLSKILEIDEIRAIKDPETQKLELRKWIATLEYFLFGDGVASVLVAKEPEGLSIHETCEVTNVHSDDYLLGYGRLTSVNEPFKFGLYTHLDKRIPESGVHYLKLILDKLEASCGVNPFKAAKGLGIHTGSEKILNLIAEHYHIPPTQLEASRNILREYGNLAGASLPFILHQILQKKLQRSDLVLMLGYGWGFSASGCTLQQT
jgi:predicted naringenin-chalcone synthase